MNVFRHLLVPTDFSETAAHALRLAVRLAREGGAAGNVRLTLLHVGSLPQAATFDFPTYGVPMPETLVQLQRELMAERSHALERLAREEIPPEVTWDPKLREGYPPEEILVEARAGTYDLIVMGTHGHTGLKHALLGSVTERVLRQAPIPVLVTH
ncbi:MAG: universal stress protein [Pseudomonadota bacterium]|nr:universal stress protein [Pseudomonadota bacterium]